MHDFAPYAPLLTGFAARRVSRDCYSYNFLPLACQKCIFRKIQRAILFFLSLLLFHFNVQHSRANFQNTIRDKFNIRIPPVPIRAARAYVAPQYVWDVPVFTFGKLPVIKPSLLRSSKQQFPHTCRDSFATNSAADYSVTSNGAGKPLKRGGASLRNANVLTIIKRARNGGAIKGAGNDPRDITTAPLPIFFLDPANKM